MRLLSVGFFCFLLLFAIHAKDITVGLNLCGEDDIALTAISLAIDEVNLLPPFSEGEYRLVASFNSSERHQAVLSGPFTNSNLNSSASNLTCFTLPSLSIPHLQVSQFDTQREWESQSLPSFPFFFHLLPPVWEEAKGMVLLLRQHNIKQVVVIASNDQFGLLGANSFSSFVSSNNAEASSNFNITILRKLFVLTMFDNSTNCGLDQLKSLNSRAFVLFLSPSLVVPVLTEAKNIGLYSNGNLFFASSNVLAMEKQLLSLSLLPLLISLKPTLQNPKYDFENTTTTATTTTSSSSITSHTKWEEFVSKWASLDTDKYPGAKKNISNKNTFAPLYYDAIYLLANAFSLAIERGENVEEGERMKKILLNSSLVGVSGSLSFSSLGNQKSGKYEIMQWSNFSSFSLVGVINENNQIFLSSPFPPIASDLILKIGLAMDTSSRRFPLYNCIFKLLLTKLNQKKAIPGYEIKTVLHHTGSDPSRGVKESSNMIDEGVAAVLGGPSSSVSIAMHLLLKSVNLLQISAVSTVDELSDKSLYPFFGRTCPSDSYQSLAAAALISSFGWKKVAVISTSDAYGSNGANKFVAAAQRNGITIATAQVISPNVANATDQVTNLRNSGANVFFIICANAQAVVVFKEAQLQGLLGPRYVWIGSDGLVDVKIDPNMPAEVYKQMEGMFFIAPSQGFGPSTDEFVQMVTQVDPVTNPGCGPNITIWTFAPYYYDSFLVVVDVFRRVIESGNKITNSTAVLQELAKTQFYGATGLLAFEKNFDRIADFDILNVQNGTSKRVKLFRSFFSNFTSFSPPIFPDGNTTPPDFTEPLIPIYVDYSHGAAIAMMVLAVLGILMNGVFITLFVVHKDNLILKAISPTFCIFILIGGILCNIEIFFWAGEPTENLCMARVWVGGFAFIFLFSPLLAKTFRVHRIFTVLNKKMEQMIITDLEVMGYLIPLFLIEMVILIVWQSVAPLRPELEKSTALTGNQRMLKCSNSDNTTAQRALIITFFVWKAVLLVFACVLAYRTRNLMEQFKESYSVMFSLYTILIISSVFIPIVGTLDMSEVAYYIIITIGIWICCNTTTVALFAYRFYYVISNKQIISTQRSVAIGSEFGHSQHGTGSSRF